MSDNDHAAARHVRALAEDMQLREARAERNRWLKMRKEGRRQFSARCRLCPPAGRDGRANGHPTFSSEVVLQSADAVIVWFDSHQRTEMHAWYRTHKHRQPFEHLIDERQKAKPKSEPTIAQMLDGLVKSEADA